MDVKRYSSSQFESIPWPASGDGKYARAYFEPMMRNGVQHYVENVRTDLNILLAEGTVLPLTINQADYDNSYVCSPYTHYVTYAEQELYLLQNPVQRAVLRKLLHFLGSAAKAANINQVACVNNWLVSTNLYPELDQEQIQSITMRLVDEFPQHTIVWRSVSEAQPTLVSAFIHAGYIPVVSRQIYWFDKRALPPTQDIKNDLRLLENTSFRLIHPEGFRVSDAGRMTELYRMLYLKKYFPTNPQYTEMFFRQAIEDKTFNLFGFERDGLIAAVMGYSARNGVIAAPIFGYDTDMPKKDGLYRLISLKLLQESVRLGYSLNSSSGAADFKRHRGAKGFLEYNMVYARNIDHRRRLFWSALAWLSTQIGGPLLKKFQL